MKHNSDFIKLSWTELLRLTIETLREGRMLSERNKWPWHVSRISEDLLTAYRTALEGVLWSGKQPAGPLDRPRSAALWKSIYSFLMGLYKDGIPTADWEQPVRQLLAAISGVKEGDIFNHGGRNDFWGEVSGWKIRSLLSEGDAWEVRDGLALKALLFGWCEAAAFTEHTNYHEEHGPYRYEGHNWYVHEYQALNETAGGRRGQISFPFNELTIVSRWRGGLKHLDVFNNWLNIRGVGVADHIVVVETSARETKGVDQSCLTLVQEKVVDLSRWVECADVNEVKAIFVEEWCRRTRGVYCNVPVVNPASIRIGGDGPGFPDLMEYLRQEEAAIAS